MLFALDSNTQKKRWPNSKKATNVSTVKFKDTAPKIVTRKLQIVPNKTMEDLHPKLKQPKDSPPKN